MQAYDIDHPEVALRLMEQCAELDDPAACFMTALWYHDGDGVPRDLKRSARWLARHLELAEQGNLEAQWDVGQNYRFANLLPLDIERANYWLETAAQNGHGEAQHHLAWYLATGQYNYPVDLEASESWYRRAFEQGHPETLYTYALRKFKNGEITEGAIALLKLAADKGFKQAEDTLRQYTN